MIHSLSSYVFGQYDRVAGRYDTGRYAHSTCGKRECLEDFIKNQAMVFYGRAPDSNCVGSSLRANADTEEILFLPTRDDNPFPKSRIMQKPTGVVAGSLLPDERKIEHSLRDRFQP